MAFSIEWDPVAKIDGDWFRAIPNHEWASSISPMRS